MHAKWSQRVKLWILQKPEIHMLLQARQIWTGASVFTRAMPCLWSMPLRKQKSNLGLISSNTSFCACPYMWLCLISRSAFQPQLPVDQYCTFLFCMQAFGPTSRGTLTTSSYINVLHSWRLLGSTQQWHFHSSPCHGEKQHCILPLAL